MKMRLVALCVAFAVSACGGGPGPQAGADFTSLRETPSGPIVGLANEYGSHSYLGIPYAQAPVGPLRWRAPRAHPTWSAPYEALDFGPSCPQFASALGGDLSAEQGTPVGSEDCLFLNVYAPQAQTAEVASGARRPVLFWIHGGGNTIGTSAFYDGGRLAAEEGAVVVTVNYRLGPLGWFRHPAIAANASPEEQSGNFALLDLAQGLAWVRENIESFGGDPGNVTIFGESAGGHNVLMLVTSPVARGLFHRAISQSGGTWTEEPFVGESATDDTPPGAEKSSAEIAIALVRSSGPASDRAGAKAHLASLDGPGTAAFLREQSATDLLSHYDDNGIGMYDMPKPFADGVVLPADGLREALGREDGHADVPILLGTNRDENKLFLYYDPEYVDLWFGVYPQVRDDARYQLAAEYLSRHWKATGTDELAELLVAQQPGRVFGYRFDWDEEPSILGKDLGQLLGAAHGFEIPFVFGHWNLGPQTSSLFVEDNAEGREALSRAMRSYWVEFATRGAPGRGLEGDLPAWKPWGADVADEKWMRLDTAASGGIGMERDLVTTDAITADLASDARLAGELRCQVAEALEGWSDFEATNLGCGQDVAAEH